MLGVLVLVAVVAVVAAGVGYLEGGKVVVEGASLWARVKAGWASLLSRVKGSGQ